MQFRLLLRPMVVLLLASISVLSGCGGGDSGGGSTAATASAIGSALNTDVVVYGATPSGIAAAIEAAHLGKHVLLLEPGQHVGGMMTNGLGHSDLYNMTALGGLVHTFFQQVRASYGSSTTADQNGTSFEPHVAEQAFLKMLAQQSTLTVIYGAAIDSVSTAGDSINSLLASNGVSYTAKIFIDASYEGDLMAMAGVSYVAGRESAQHYGESLAGVQSPQLPAGLQVDPYVTAGDATSGLLPHIESTALGALGSADDGLMAYNFRLCLSADPNNQIAFAAPTGYDPKEFEALGRWIQAAQASGALLTLNSFLTFSALPSKKFDLNNGGGLLSTDDVGANTDYIAASATVRKQIAAEHQHYLQSLLYFLRSDSRLPDAVRTALTGYGLCKDEFTDNNGWPQQLYIREARRMTGAYVMTQNDVEGKTTIGDSIGLGGYTLDSHYVHRVVVNASIFNEGGTHGTVATPYPIAYRALTPQASQRANLLVSVAVSASHVAYESLRVEPTQMIMGQAAGAAAALAIDEGVSVQNVNYAALTQQLQADGQILKMP